MLEMKIMRISSALAILVGTSCHGVGSPSGAIIEYGGDVEIAVVVRDAQTRAPLAGVEVCEYYSWVINGRKCESDSHIGVTNPEGRLIATFSTINGSVDAILVKDGYEPLHVHDIAQSPTGGRIDFGEMLLARRE